MKVIYISSVSPISKSLLQKIFLLLAFTTISTFTLLAQCTNNYVQIGSYHIEFVDVRYDFPAEGQSTWYYRVEATAGKDISHVTFPLNKNCIDVLDSGTWGTSMDDLNSGQGKPNVGKDPKAKIWGMKFDEGVNTSDEQNYYFTLDKNLAVENVDKMAIKAGKPFYFGTICGPSPDCNEVTNEPAPAVNCISGQVFNDANQNGIRDADETSIEGVVVTLYFEFGIAGEVVTGADGKYSFCDLDPMEYAVFMMAAAEYSETLSNVGSDEFDSDIVYQGFTDVLTLNAGENLENIDGGFFIPSDIAFFNRSIADTPEYVNRSTKKSFLHSSFTNTIPGADVTVDMQVFPNPVVNQVTFKKSPKENNNVIVEIRDAKFNLIMTRNIEDGEVETTFNLSQLPNGIYFAHITSDKKSTIKKIVKMD